MTTQDTITKTTEPARVRLTKAMQDCASKDKFRYAMTYIQNEETCAVATNGRMLFKLGVPLLPDDKDTQGMIKIENAAGKFLTFSKGENAEFPNWRLVETQMSKRDIVGTCKVNPELLIDLLRAHIAASKALGENLGPAVTLELLKEDSGNILRVVGKDSCSILMPMRSSE